MSSISENKVPNEISCLEQKGTSWGLDDRINLYCSNTKSEIFQFDIYCFPFVCSINIAIVWCPPPPPPSPPSSMSVIKAVAPSPSELYVGVLAELAASRSMKSFGA